jgi:serine phosphatase RsbU (regulator of sigma subunit)
MTNSEAPLSELKSAVLKSLYEYTEKKLTHDDVTLIAMEIC